MKRSWRKPVMNGLIAIVIIVGLALLAHVLVNSLNIVELIKHFHGG